MHRYEAEPARLGRNGRTMGAMDEGILAEFLAESFENLAQVEHDLVALERDPEDRKRIGGIFRAVHTIKGTCGFFGLKRLEALAHAGENLLSRLRCGEIVFTPALADTLLRLVDALRAILSAIETTRQEGDADYAPLLDELVRLERAPAMPAAEGDTKAAPAESAEGAAPADADAPGPPPRGGLLDPLIAQGRLD